MKKTFLLTLFFPFFLLASFKDLDLDCKAAILINAENGKVLYEKNGYKKCFPASLTKMATALYVIENSASLDLKIPISQEALLLKEKNQKKNFPYLLEKDGSVIGLKQGEKASLKSLLYALLIASGNDAANVIAEAVGGSIPEFMQDVNEYLQYIGCKDTYFVNPHGLHHSEHVSTAYDLAKLGNRAMQDPFFRKIVSSERYFFPKTNQQEEKRLLQTNALVCRESLDYYPYAIGIKTGYTSNAGHNVAVAAEYKGRFLIAIILGAKSSGNRYAQAKKLFNLAFSEEKKKRVVIKKEKKFSFLNETGQYSVPAVLKEDVTFEYFPSEKRAIKAFIEWDPFVAPIKKGQIVGQVVVKDEQGNKITSEPLYAEMAFSHSFFSFFKNFFK